MLLQMHRWHRARAAKQLREPVSKLVLEDTHDSIDIRIPMADLLKCSFCGRPSSEVASLFKAPAACICDSCVELASAILSDRRSGKISAGSSSAINIGPYKVNHKLARLLGKSVLLHREFVPLDLYDPIVVVAVSDLGQTDEILARIRETLAKSSKPSGGNQETEVNIFLATRESIRQKIEEFVED